MKRTFIRSLCFLMSALLTGAVAAPFSAFAGNTVNVSSTGVTTISLADSYVDFGDNGRSNDKLYIEKNLCPEAYFDCLRKNDYITVQIQVSVPGTYQVCLVTGWADNVTNGTFVFTLDGDEIGTLVNKVPGAGWRAWRDTTSVTVDLPAGTHDFTIISKTDGPNVQGLKFAPENVKISEVTGYAAAYSGNQGAALEIQGTFAMQFNASAPIKEITAACPSYNNDKGTLVLSLYKWVNSYEETLRGKPVASKSYVDFKDNATLSLPIDGYADAGEYLFYIENKSPAGEQVGIWTTQGTIENVRVFRDDQVIEPCALIKVKYIGEDFSFLPLSALCQNEVDPTASDLYPTGDFVRRDMAANDKYGVRFNAGAAFTGAEVYVPAAPSDTAGNHLTLSLYAWKGSYQKTIAEKPIKSEVKTNIARGTWVRLDCGSQPAGEYLFTITDGVTNMQVCTVENKSGTAELYVNGAACRISLVSRLAGFNGQFTVLGAAEPTEFINPGVWTAVDGLGRTVTTAAEAGPRRDKFVGIFYHTWHSSHYRNKIINGTETIRSYPEAQNDFKHPAWQGITTVFWDEPVWGYYNNGVDRWVLRNQAELLADADIDVVIFDNTNGTENYMAGINELLEVWAEARLDGVKAPGISAMLNMFNYQDAATQIRELYDNIYSKGLYQDLWFMWEGKPLMVGSPSGLNKRDEHDKEILDFFSWRPINPCYTQDYRQIIENGVVTTQWAPDTSLLRKYTFWKWISVYPQQSMLDVTDKSVEEMSVSVAQNWSDAKGLTAMNAGYDNQYGRAYSVEKGFIIPTEDAILWGQNFKDQFEYALSVDPDFIYITGWNEWVAGRYKEMWGTENALPDNATAGFSRDIEPSNGVLKDHYYYQMVSFIRRFKGVEPQETANVSKTIRLDGGLDQWADVGPEFLTYAHNVGERHYDGYQGYHYDNATGRNDIVSAKVTYDADNVYFMVTTAEDVTDPAGENWMRLFIGVEGSDAPAWESFGFVINRTSPGEKAVLEKSTGGWAWEKVADVDYAVSGNLLQIAIPRTSLGVDGHDFVINFKWADHNLADGDLMSVYTDGDAAPCGRFRFTYNSLIPAPETMQETETAVETEPVTSEVTDDPADTTPSKGCRSSIAVPAVCATAAIAAVSLSKRRKRKED